MKNIWKKLKKCLGIRKRISHRKVKQYIFFIPMFKVKWSSSFIKVYFLGIRVLTYYCPGVDIVGSEDVSGLRLAENMKFLKSLECINSRQSCNYENGAK